MLATLHEEELRPQLISGANVTDVLLLVKKTTVAFLGKVYLYIGTCWVLEVYREHIILQYLAILLEVGLQELILDADGILVQDGHSLGPLGGEQLTQEVFHLGLPFLVERRGLNKEWSLLAGVAWVEGGYDLNRRQGSHHDLVLHYYVVEAELNPIVFNLGHDTQFD